MLKKGAIRHNWTDRHFRLGYSLFGKERKLELEYAAKEKKGRALVRVVKGTIDLSVSGCIARPSEAPELRRKPFEIELVTPTRTYRIAAHNVKQMQEWLLALTVGIKAAKEGPHDKHKPRGGTSSPSPSTAADLTATQPAAETDESVVFEAAGDGIHYFKKFPDGLYCQTLYVKAADGAFTAVGSDALKVDSYEPADDGTHFFKKFADGQYCQKVYVKDKDGAYVESTAAADNGDESGEYVPAGDGQHFFKKIGNEYCQKVYIQTADGKYHPVESHN